MFRNMFVTCLALVLALSMTLQATPALAQGQSAEPGAGSQGILIAVNKVSLVRGLFPPRVRIEGTLPDSCTELVVDKPAVGKLNLNTSITPITIRVRGVRQPDYCTTLTKPFKITVTLDPFKLHLAPGRYRVRVNPRVGQNLNQVLITIPPNLD